jgi:alcohol dehydrogenase class IV
VENLVLELGLPLSLPDIGVRSEHFLGLAEEVMQDLVVAESPREVLREDVIEILASAS